MILFHPVPPMRILQHYRQRSGRRAIAPEILPVSLLVAARALADQPAYMPRAIAIDAPTPERQALRPPPAFAPLTPDDRLPRVQGLRREHGVDPLHGTART